MKTGRNMACPCGSGKKYKRCCGDSNKSKASTEQTLRARAQEMLRAHNAAEDVRQQQQGYGKPILSMVDNGYRLVVVGKKVFWSKNWLVFPDFLFYFVKNTFGFEWGARAQKENSPHPIFRWLSKINEHVVKYGRRDGRLKSWPLVGFISATLHLAYALYLIAHHDQIPKRLLRRLRDPATFLPAYYETLVGAALAVAGFEIANAETKPTSEATPEFRARSKASGKIYEVEAKRKDRWTVSTTDVESDEFKRELKRYIRDQIYKASRKKLQNPVFWLELSIPTLTEEADWVTIATNVESVVREAEKMTTNGEPVAPAFVVITNHTFLANEDIAGEGVFALVKTLRIPDYPFGRRIEIEEALEGYDKYRDIFWMMDAWRLARTIPTTFDGSPPELLSPDGQPQRTVQIGDMLLVPDQSGKEFAVRVEEITSIGDRVVVAVHHVETDRHWIAELPLTAGEVQAVARFTDAIFGKDHASRPLREGDPFDLYDWVLKAYADSTPEELAKLIREDPDLQQYGDLSPRDARVRLAREYTKRIWADSNAKKKTSSNQNQT